MQSITNRVIVSSTNFDTLISKHHPKANVTFTIPDLEIKMDILFEMNPNKDKKDNTNKIILSIKFYHKDREIDYSDIYESQFIELINAYSKYVIDLGKKNININIQKKHLSFNLISILTNLKSLRNKLNIILKLKEIKKVLEQYQNLKAVDMYTNIKSRKKVDNDSNNIIIARTTIELDADIITIISKDLLLENNSNNINNQLLSLHKSNVYLSNYLFLYPLFRIVIAVKTVKYVTSLLPAPITAPVYTISYPSLIGPIPSPPTPEFYIPFILGSIGIPAILFKVISKYAFPLIFNRLAGQTKFNI
jgi:hypothetical protein